MTLSPPGNEGAESVGAPDKSSVPPAAVYLPPHQEEEEAGMPVLEVVQPQEPDIYDVVSRAETFIFVYNSKTG